MKLIVGLGNPGLEYKKTRHNIGWDVIENLAKQYNGTWKSKPKFNADVSEATILNQKILMAKPTNYYNLSGESVRKICDFYDIETKDVLVIHDELALPTGSFRLRIGGSDAGNNGVKSLIQHLGDNFARIRIGSGLSLASENGDARPESSHRNHVLSRPNKSDQEKIDALYSDMERAVIDFIRDDFKPQTVKI